MELTENALEVLRARYFKQDQDGKVIEDWAGLCRRVADYIASAEAELESKKWAEVFFETMNSLKFLPNSPTLFNAGMSLGNLSACFVLPIEDSLQGIFEALKNAAMVFASGGGCGYDFSSLRKRGSPVSRTQGVSSGPVSFIQAFDAVTDVIKQGGKRKGANMGILRIDHPDIEEFLDAKKQEGKLANFNLSVAVTDKFMQAVRKQGDTTGDLFELYDNHTKRVDREISATYLFNKIVNGLWSNGEPGVLFIDEINRKHPLRGLGEISGTNPCSEQPLLPNESCNLGSINLTKFCVPGRGGNLDDDIDWRALENTIEVAVRFLDDVITVNRYSVKDVEEATLRTRKIGLGVMGWADLLLMLGISYDSEVVTHLAEKVMEFIQHHALKASAYLAKERGAFPAFKDHYCFIDRPESLWQQEDLDWFALNNCIVQHGLRNACVTTIAPTGSLSLIAGCSSGIEPNFQWEYTYHRVDREFVEKHELAATYLESGKELPEYFVTALDIAPEWHLKMQSAFQKWVDAGISKTINLPTSATREEVADAIMLAWELKCKGVTLYRSGSRQQEVLVAKKPPVVEERRITPRKRPVTTSGDTMKIPVGDNCGSMFITVNHDETGPCECFINLGRSGGCISSHSEALGRLISLALRSGVDPSEIVDQLKGIRCSKVRWTEGKAVHSCADAVAYALEKMLGLDRTSGEHSAPLTSKDIELACDTLFRNRGKEFLALEEEMKLFGPDRKDPLTFRVIALGENPECSECHSILSVEGRCLSCRACGWTKCV